MEAPDVKFHIYRMAVSPRGDYWAIGQDDGLHLRAAPELGE